MLGVGVVYVPGVSVCAWCGCMCQVWVYVPGVGVCARCRCMCQV